MSQNDNTHIIDATSKSSRLQKIKTFANEHKGGIILTTAFVTGATLSYIGMKNAEAILEKSSDTLETASEKLDDAAENIANPNQA